MSRVTYLTLIAVVLICGAILVSQTVGNYRLESRLESEQRRISQLNQEIEQLGNAESGLPARASSNSIKDSEKGIAGRSRNEITAEERIANARSRIEFLVVEIDQAKKSPALFFKILPDLLRVVQDLSLDELIDVAKSIDAPINATLTTPDGKTMTRIVLLLLAAEQDPVRIMEETDMMNNTEMRQSLLGSLARHDSEAAMEWLRSAEISEVERKRVRAGLTMQVFRQDIETGLKFMREFGEDADAKLGQLEMISLASEQIPDAIAAMGEPKNADVRSKLFGMVLRSSLVQGGIAAAREQAEQLEFEPAELAEFFRKQGIVSDPEGTLDWMLEAQSPEHQKVTVPKAIGQWTQKDYNAAANWLGKMEPSGVKDEAIKVFSGTVLHMDPEAATIWAAEIQDGDLRERAIQSAAKQWLGKDSATASEWLEKNGIDISKEEMAKPRGEVKAVEVQLAEPLPR